MDGRDSYSVPMSRRTMLGSTLLAPLLLCLAGCESERCVELTQQPYRGMFPATPLRYYELVFEPNGVLSSFASANGVPVGDTYSSSTTCKPPQEHDEPGWELVAWIDGDGAEQQACAEGAALVVNQQSSATFRAACAPSA